jgi:hypothetical protein
MPKRIGGCYNGQTEFRGDTREWFCSGKLFSGSGAWTDKRPFIYKSAREAADPVGFERGKRWRTAVGLNPEVVAQVDFRELRPDVVI